MAEGSSKAQVISLGADSGPIIVQRGGIKVEFDGWGGVDVFSNVPVVVHPATNDDGKSKANAEPKVGPNLGDVMPDGTIYTRLSPDTGKAMYATPN